MFSVNTLFGWTKLHIAADRSDNQALAKELEMETDLDASDYQGRTALHFAVSNKNIEGAKLLVKHGAKLDIADKACCIPLHIAIEVGSLELIELCLRKEFINLSNKDGNTALHIAIAMHLENPKSQVYTNIIKLLVSNGANLRFRNNDALDALGAINLSEELNSHFLLAQEAEYDRLILESWKTKNACNPNALALVCYEQPKLSL